MRRGPVAEERPAPSSRSDVGMQLRQDRRFADRSAAGRALAVELRRLFGTRRTDVVVLGLPRGGAPVAAPVARSLHAPLDVLLVRKLGLPGQPELAMGAIAGVGGAVEVVRNDRVVAEAGVSAEQFDRVLADQVRDASRSGAALPAWTRSSGGGSPRRPRRRRPGHRLDDARRGRRRCAGAGRRPWSSPFRSARPSSCRSLAREVDRLICLRQPHDFRAVGQAYGDFSPTSDDEVESGAGHRWMSERLGDVLDQVGGVLDAAAEPDEAGRHVVAAPTGAPLGGGVHAAEARRLGQQLGLAQELLGRGLVGEGERDQPVAAPQQLPSRASNDGSAGSHGCRTSDDGRVSRRAAARRPARSRPAGPAGRPAWPATGGPATPRTGPGSHRSRSASSGSCSASSASRVATWPSSRSLCPDSAFVSLATARSAPRVSAGRPSGVAVVVSTATSAPAAWAPPPPAGGRRRRRAAGWSAPRARAGATPSSSGEQLLGPARGGPDHDAELVQRAVGERRGSRSSSRRAAPGPSPAGAW